MKVTLFEAQCHWGQDVDPPLRPRKQTTQYGTETSDITSHKSVMLTLFWDVQGPILEHYVAKGTIVNGVHYTEMLWDQLMPAIQTTCN